jgi:hypothetical protein
MGQIQNPVNSARSQQSTTSSLSNFLLLEKYVDSVSCLIRRALKSRERGASSTRMYKGSSSALASVQLLPQLSSPRDDPRIPQIFKLFDSDRDGALSEVG